MKEAPDSQDPAEALEPIPDILEDLQELAEREVRKIRFYDRAEVRMAVHLRPGNKSDDGSFETVGTTRNFSEGGCRAVFPVPPRVGDVYRLRIERPDGKFPWMFARCLRVQFMDEDSFDCAFMFFASLALADIGLDDQRD